MFRPKYHVPEKLMDFTSKISIVSDETSCDKHGASQGQPCWIMDSNSGREMKAVCGKRSKKVFTGPAIPTTRNTRSKQGVRK